MDHLGSPQRRVPFPCVSNYVATTNQTPHQLQDIQHEQNKNSLLLDRIRLPRLCTKAPIKDKTRYPRSFPIMHFHISRFTLLRILTRHGGFSVQVKVGSHSIGLKMNQHLNSIIILFENTHRIAIPKSNHLLSCSYLSTAPQPHSPTE